MKNEDKDENLKLGKTLIICNPVSHSGKGKSAANVVENALSEVTEAELKYTSCKQDAIDFAKDSAGYDSIFVIGGDGTIHDVICGLMELPRDSRPRLGIIPMGTGNDYARTLGVVKNSPLAAVRSLINGSSKGLTIGKINDTYFMETLSFGLDSAIAIESANRRANESAETGSFLAIGLDIFKKYHGGWAYDAKMQTVGEDGSEIVKKWHANEIVFACQVGPTYGGGFKICPEASPLNSYLDACYARPPASTARTITLFLKAKFGGHTKSDYVSMAKFKNLHLDFEIEPPVQVDGEEYAGHKSFDVTCIPDALDVIVP